MGRGITALRDVDLQEGSGEITCIFNKFPGDASTACPRKVL